MQALVNRLRYVFDLQQTKREAANRSLLIKTRSGYQLTPVSDILFVERSNRKNRIVTQSGAEIHPMGYTMNQLEQMLEGCGFYRCYQSFIVNLSKVSFIRADGSSKTYAIQFDGYDGEVLLSRDKYPELLTLLKEKYANIDFWKNRPAGRSRDVPGRPVFYRYFDLVLVAGLWRPAPQHIPLVIRRMMVRSVSRMPSLARVPTLRMVFSTPLTTMPSPP